MPSNCSYDSTPEIWQLIVIIIIILLLLAQIIFNSLKLFIPIQQQIYKIINPSILGIIVLLMGTYLISSLVKDQKSGLLFLSILFLIVLGISIYFVVFSFIQVKDPLSTPPPLASSFSSGPSTLYLFDKNSVTPLELQKKFNNISSVQDVTHAGGTTLFLDDQGTIYFLNDQGYQGSVPQSIKMSKIRQDDKNITYGLSNGTLYVTNDLSSWSPLFQEVKDFDIPQDKSIMYVNYLDGSKGSFLYNLQDKQIIQTYSTNQDRIYGRNPMEFIYYNSGWIRSDGSPLPPNVTKAVFDDKGKLYPISLESKMKGNQVLDVFSADNAIIYKLST
jgi:hypothetical protein